MRKGGRIVEGVIKCREFVHTLPRRNADGEALDIECVQVRKTATALG